MKRASDDADRRTRRRAILSATEELLINNDGGLPSVSRIAAAAGLAKGTLYLYFATKEEILAALLHQLWEPMLAAFEEELACTDRPLGDRSAAFADRFARYCDEHRHLLRLDAIAKEVIERNMTPAALMAHKAGLHASLMETAACLEDALMLPEGRGYRILTRTHALMRGLWQSFGDQSAGPPEPAVYAFTTELREATAEYLQGALP